MHKYLRAVGFSGINSREKLQSIIALTIKNAKERSFTTLEDDVLLAEYTLSFGPGFGLTVCGEMDKEDRFVFEYCYPFLRADNVSSDEKVTIERHAATISYAGVFDDERMGITIIFYLLNRIPYVMKRNTNSLPSSGTTISLTGLSLEGTIVMPVVKNPKEEKKATERRRNRNILMEAAKKGDESAIETLTLKDMDMYSQISRKIRYCDVYTLVETYFMPYGVECDQYSILGEIELWREEKNSVTGEVVYEMLLNCNEMKIAVCINKADLVGEPEVGRRFKGNIWLQGYINYPGTNV